MALVFFYSKLQLAINSIIINIIITLPLILSYSPRPLTFVTTAKLFEFINSYINNILVRPQVFDLISKALDVSVIILSD